MTQPIAVVPPKINATINNVTIPLPVKAFTVHRGAYGVIGNCSITSSLYAWRYLGAPTNPKPINLSTVIAQAIESSAPALVPVELDIQYQGAYYPSVNRGFTRLFSGVIDRVRQSLHGDQVMIDARDQSSVLLDTQTVLSGLNYANMTPSALVSQLADKYGFLITYISTVANEPTVGALIKQEGVGLMTRPQSVWSVLEFLARTMGYSLFVDQSGGLHFEPPAISQAPNTIFTYAPPAYSNDPEIVYAVQQPPVIQNIAGTTPLGTGLITQNTIPLKECDVTWQPHKNKSFAVVVYSQDPITKKPVKAVATNGKSKSLGLIQQLGLPIYSRHVPGQTLDRALQIAKGLAEDIAKHEFVVDGVIDGYPDINPLWTTQIYFTDQTYNIDNISSKTLFISSVTHSFDMTNGYQTKFTALLIPSEVSIGS